MNKKIHCRPSRGNPQNQLKTCNVALRATPPAVMRTWEAALVSGVSEKTIQREIRSKALKASYLGRRLVLVRRECLFDWIDGAERGDV